MAATLSLEYAAIIVVILVTIVIFPICVATVATVHHMMHSAYMTSLNEEHQMSKLIIRFVQSAK